MSPGLPEPGATPSTIADLEAKLRTERRKLAAVRELQRALGATLDLDRLLQLLLTKVTEIVDAERATLFLVDGNGEQLVSKIMEGGATVQEIRLRIPEGVAGWVARTGETANIADAYADPRFKPEVDQSTGFHTRSILCMPMNDHQGRVIGVIQALNKRLGTFDGDDEALLAAVAGHSGIAIENSKLYLSVLAKNAALLEAQDQLRRRLEELDILVEIQRDVSEAVNLDELLSRLLARAMELIESEAGAVLLRHLDSGELFFRAAAGGSAAVRRLQLGPGQGVAGWVAEKRQPLIVNDPQNDARHDSALTAQIGFGVRNLIAVPLLSASFGSDGGAQESLGTIELLNRRSRRGFDDADLKLLLLIAGHASRAIQLARFKEERENQGRLASVGQLLSGIMHDLKSPMTIASGYVQLMAQTEDQPTRERYSELIARQFDHMAAMTREVLSFARGESKLLVRKVYMHTFLSEVAQHLEKELAGKKVRLEIDSRFNSVAWFDELKLHRVAQNIARNAAQAMPDGGTFRIVTDVDPAANKFWFEFSDTGRGIPQDLEGRMFQLFATSGKKDGTGLGLAIVKKIVEEHGGQVSYRSRPGEGTTFRVELPLKRDG